MIKLIVTHGHEWIKFDDIILLGKVVFTTTTVRLFLNLVHL